MQKVTYFIIIAFILPLFLFAQSKREMQLTSSTDQFIFETLVQEFEVPTNELYSNEPACSLPTNVRATNTTGNETLISWDGLAPQPELLYYRVRYRPQVGTKDWQFISVKDGNQILLQGLESATKYEVEVQKICYWKDGSEIYSDWVPSSLPIESKVTLPTFTCGSTYQYTTPNCETTNQVVNGDHKFSVIYYGGFPIEIQSITSDSNYVNGILEVNWSGTGLIPLPFGVDKYATVSFSSIIVNLNNQVCSTRGIEVERDVPPNLPELIPTNGYGNAEICVPKPSSEGFDSSGINKVTGLPWDTYGFGQNGKYIKMPPYPGYLPGFPMDTTLTYDPNGFNAQGINAITQTAFNPNGCSRDSLDVNGQPCNPTIPPYSWMNSSANNPQTAEGLAYAAQIKDSLNIYLIQILNSLNAANTVKLNIQVGKCDSIRTIMQADVTLSGVNSTFVFGPDNKYFDPGMHQNFSAPPQLLTSSSWDHDRKPSIIDLEKQHIALYHCDIKQYEFIHLEEVISSFLSGSGLNDLHDKIIDLITRQNAETITKFINDQAYFITWLRDQVKITVSYKFIELHGNATVGIDEYEENPFLNKHDTKYKNNTNRSGFSTTSLLASNDLSLELFSQSQEVTSEDLKFEYLQGFKRINGVNRAFYLEAVANARNANMVTTQANPYLMPIELLSYGEDGKGFRIYLDNIQFFNDHPATMDVFIIIDVPFNGQRIAFESIGVSFTPYGLMTSNGIRLQMNSDFAVRISNNARLILKGGANTYVKMDCLGFAGMGIEADVELCRNIVKPIDPITQKVLPEPKRVQGHFITTMSSWSSLYVKIGIDPFVITGVEDVKWKVDSIVLDLSETNSPSGTPPPGYETTLANHTGFKPLWKGFYAKDIQVTLPRRFRKDNTPLVVGVHNLIIDPMGVSGVVTATDLLPLNQGNADGWGMSIKNFELTVLMSNVSKAEFDGKIHVPLFRDSTNTTNTLKPEDCFNYTARIVPNSIYQFTVSQQKGVVYAADMWKVGSVHLDSSLVQLAFANDSFSVFARLSGGISLNANISANLPITIPSVTFQRLEISNRAPYFSPGTWQFPVKIGAKFAGFEIGVTQVGMTKTEVEEPALNFDAFIQITDSTYKVSANGGFSLVGRLEVIDGEQHWRYKRLRIKEIDIDGNFNGVAKIHGFAKFYEGHPTFGTGFRGALDAKFDILSAEIKVIGQFGRVNSMKYFMVDALYCADAGKGINLAGAFELTGIGGGAYYHMSRPDQAINFGGCGTPIDTTLGVSLSGIHYLPTDTVLFGIKLTVAGGTTGSPEAFNLNASIEFQFSSGSLDKIWLSGNGKFMAPLDLEGVPTYLKDQLPNNNAAVSANVDILLNFEQKIFSGTLETYMNVAGVLIGADPGKPFRVCFAEVKFAPNEWYIKVGRPSQRVGIKAIIPGMDKPLYEFLSYLQIGQNIDPLPELPQDIREVLKNHGETEEDYNESRIKTQYNGFAFGVDVRMGGKFKYLALYSQMDAHLGFDLNVAKSVTPLLCNGEPFGINGWYAQGQIYASLSVEMGLEAKIFGSKKQFKILSAMVGAALEAKLPNPFWARGQVAYQFNIMNAIKGNGNFRFEIGEKCEFTSEGSVADNIAVILDVRPGTKSENVHVSSTPNATFNFPIGETFSFEELNGGNNAFKIILDTAQLYWRGYSIPIREKTWTADKQQLRLKPESFLPGNDTIQMIVSVHIDSNDVTIGRERRAIWFKTGNGLKTIIASNVKGSYPMNGQYNYYRNELQNGKGYIQLDRGQPDVMLPDDPYIKVARFRKSGGNCRFVKLEFSSENFWDKKVEFPLPDASFFEADKVYEMQIVDFPKNDPKWGSDFSGPAPCTCAGCIPPPVTTTPPVLGGILTTSVTNSNQDDGLPPGNNNPATVVTERIVYAAYFRVSEYDRFADKMEVLNISMPQVKPGSLAEEAPGIPGDLEFEVPNVIEPFDWCDLKFMDRKISFENGLSLPYPTFLTRIPRLYQIPWISPNITYSDGILTTKMPVGKAYYPIEKSFEITSSNNTGLKITKQHYLNGIPSNFRGAQLFKMFVCKSFVNNAEGLIKSKTVYETTYMSQIRAAANCQSNTQPLCDCPENIWQNFEDYEFIEACDGPFPSTGIKSYPMRFTYKFPGTEQTLGGSFLIILNH